MQLRSDMVLTLMWYRLLSSASGTVAQAPTRVVLIQETCCDAMYDMVAGQAAFPCQASV